MVKKYIFCFIILIIMLFSFAGCSGIDGEMKSVSVEKKSSSEIEYLENEIFTIINKFSKNEYEKDNGIDWKDVNKDAQKIGKVLDTVMLDFGEAKVSNDELNNLRNEKLTDTTAVYLGFKKYMLNGYRKFKSDTKVVTNNNGSTRTDTYTKIGYLEVNEINYIVRKLDIIKKDYIIYL